MRAYSRSIALCVALLSACRGDPSAASEADAGQLERAGAPGFCERSSADKITDLFCQPTPPAIDSFQALLSALALGPKVRAIAAEQADPSVPRYRTVGDFEVMLGHSTSLSGHLVSSINPRALLFSSGTMVAYQRGVQQVEIIVADRLTGRLNFYLLSFQQACSSAEAGCAPSDLFTPRVERDWLSVSVQDDEQLKNSPFDCRQCHQRNRERPMLLMRELNAPWTHYFEGADDSRRRWEPGVRGFDLMDDYFAAKGDEVYAGLDRDAFRQTVGFEIEQVVPREQPLLFDAPAIDAERWPYQEDGTYAGTPGPSPTWEAAYEAFKRGEQLALPYLETRASDPDKLSKLTAAYQQYAKGELPADQLPDLSDIYPDDPWIRARIGLQTEPNATPAQLLIQACGSCHNDVLDQTVSRALFNIDLTKMDRRELGLAIDRIERTQAEDGAMPPKEFRQLDADGRARLVAYLRAGVVSYEEQATLKHAAERGMAGGAAPKRSNLDN